LNGLPVKDRPSAKEHAHSQSSHQAEYASQKGDNGGRREAKPLPKRGEFRKPWDFQYAHSAGIEIGTPRTASVAVE
jgi:hypothetical protein